MKLCKGWVFALCGGQSDTGHGCGLAAVNIPLLSGPRPVTRAKLAANNKDEVPGKWGARGKGAAGGMRASPRG